MKTLAVLFASCCLIFSGFFCSNVALAANPAANLSPAGNWKTIDDVTGAAKSIMALSLDQNQQLSGRVVKIFPHDKVDDKMLCTECSGNLKNKPVKGMTVLWGLKPSNREKTEWDGGSILDPKNGKVYHCKVKVIDNGAKLSVRGYLGISLLGRSQVWLRVDKVK